MKTALRLAVVLGLILPAARARADALDAFPRKPISVEFRSVRVDAFFQMVGDMAGVPVSVDPCAADKALNVKMINAPLDVVLRAIGQQQHLGYRFDGQKLSVVCGEVAAEPGRAAAVPTVSHSGDAAPSTAALTSTVVALRTENAALREQLKQFQAERERHLADLQTEQGTPQTAPTNLAPRFSSEALLANLGRALREAGLQDAQITSIDCSEYPCIVYGDGMSALEDTRKVEGAASFAPYAKDLVSSFGWNADASGNPASSHWGLALYPSDDSGPNPELSKRLRYRSSQMFASFGAKR